MKHKIHWIATNAAEFPRSWCGVAKPAAGSTALIEVTCQRCLMGVGEGLRETRMGRSHGEAEECFASAVSGKDSPGCAR